MVGFGTAELRRPYILTSQAGLLQRQGSMDTTELQTLIVERLPSLAQI